MISSKRRKIENLALMLRGAMDAQNRVGLMLNVRKQDLAAVLAVLPALKKPTISTLSDDDWVAVNTVIEESHGLAGHSSAERSQWRRASSSIR